MNRLEFHFQNQIIEFDMSATDVMINATEMGKIYGKRPVDFLKQENTKLFLQELKSASTQFRSDGASLLNAGNNDFSDENIVRSDRGRGVDGGSTWMCRQLALKFASWLDAKFEVWVYQTIDKLLFEHARQTTTELKEKAKLTDRREELITHLQSNTLFQEFMQVEMKIKQSNHRITKYNTNQLSIFRGL